MRWREAIDDETGLYYRTNAWLPGRMTLVFIHGLSASSSAWVPFEARYASAFNTLAIDLRGHGHSRRYPHRADYALASAARDIASMLDTLTVGNYVIVAHSFGALVAAHLAEARPSGLSGAVCIAGVYELGHLKRFAGWRGLLGAVSRVLDRFPVPQRKSEHIDYRRFASTGDWNARRIATDIRNTGVRTFLFGLYNAFDDSGRVRWASLGGDALFIHGSHDSFIPFTCARRVAAANGYSCVVLPGANHIVPTGHPERVMRAMEHFLSERVRELSGPESTP